ncbi:hypothetical protein CONLIGDRAFT_99165 [Coniochaeta ligniaria NRRL 30616]|uniref:Uncharacterized protein n=1 Tax=Coniochaeta ligniaria NRRL 30616 TaxID=1408157 RepID=A0A1J7J5T3_9PEZI|nr:hypothetical protein CONLIGDRAFT_99165 [Coniochaeta ligniaria NRRL 30616]
MIGYRHSIFIFSRLCRDLFPRMFRSRRGIVSQVPLTLPFQDHERLSDSTGGTITTYTCVGNHIALSGGGRVVCQLTDGQERAKGRPRLLYRDNCLGAALGTSLGTPRSRSKHSIKPIPAPTWARRRCSLVFESNVPSRGKNPSHTGFYCASVGNIESSHTWVP